MKKNALNNLEVVLRKLEKKLLESDLSNVEDREQTSEVQQVKKRMPQDLVVSFSDLEKDALIDFQNSILEVVESNDVQRLAESRVINTDALLNAKRTIPLSALSESYFMESRIKLQKSLFETLLETYLNTSNSDVAKLIKVFKGLIASEVLENVETEEEKKEEKTEELINELEQASQAIEELIEEEKPKTVEEEAKKELEEEKEEENDVEESDENEEEQESSEEEEKEEEEEETAQNETNIAYIRSSGLDEAIMKAITFINRRSR